MNTPSSACAPATGRAVRTVDARGDAAARTGMHEPAFVHGGPAPDPRSARQHARAEHADEREAREVRRHARREVVDEELDIVVAQHDVLAARASRRRAHTPRRDSAHPREDQLVRRAGAAREARAESSAFRASMLHAITDSSDVGGRQWRECRCTVPRLGRDAAGAEHGTAIASSGSAMTRPARTNSGPASSQRDARACARAASSSGLMPRASRPRACAGVPSMNVATK